MLAVRVAIAAAILSFPVVAEAQDELIYLQGFFPPGEAARLASLVPDGTDPPEFVGDPAPSYPIVTPDGRKMVVDDNSADPRGLYLTDLDGANPFLLLSRDDASFTAYDVSADGSRLAYVAGNALFVKDVIADTTFTVVPDGVNSGGGFPRLSHDGTNVLFAKGSLNFRPIWLAEVEGDTEPFALTDPEAMGGESVIDYRADWSADGQWVVFARRQRVELNHHVVRVGRVSVDGTGETSIYERSFVGLNSGLWNLQGVEIAPDAARCALLTRINGSEITYGVHLIEIPSGAIETRYEVSRPGPDAFFPDGLGGWTVVPEPVPDLIVNDDGDAADFDVEDGECDSDAATPGLQCTLRAALETANADSDPSMITFELDGAGPHTIHVLSPLPDITTPVTLDGTTPPEFEERPVVALDGSAAGAGAVGLTILAANCTVSGLAIHSFDDDGIFADNADGLVVEYVISGSDGDGTDGLGNGGDGIHVTGTGLVSIGDSPAFGDPDAFNVAVLSNGGYGLNLDSPAGAARIRSGRTPDRALGINIGSASLGMLLTNLESGLARPNALGNFRARGIAGLFARGLRVGPTPGRGGLFEACQNVRLSNSVIGALSSRIASAFAPAFTALGGLRFESCSDVLVGGDDPSDCVEGVSSGGWFMEVEDTQAFEARGILGGLTQDHAGRGPSELSAMKNAFGGVRLKNCVGSLLGGGSMTPPPTVFSNNGGPGVLISGPQTNAVTAQALHLGTTPEGAIVGNDGDGICVEDDAGGLTIGGLGSSRVFSGNNGGYGFLFRNLRRDEGSRGARAININARGLLSGLFPDGDSLIGMPNLLSNVCVQNSIGLLFEKVSLGLSGLHGLEIMGGSKNVTVHDMSIGTEVGRALKSTADVLPPDGHGIHIDDASDITIGDPESDGADIRILGSGKWGAALRKVTNGLVQNLQVGSAPDEKLSQELESALVNRFGGLLFEDCGPIEVRRASLVDCGDDDLNPTAAQIRAFESSQMQLLDVYMQARLSESDRLAVKAIVTGSTSMAMRNVRVEGSASAIESTNSLVNIRGLFVGVQRLFGGASPALVKMAEASRLHLRDGVVTDALGDGVWFDVGSGGTIHNSTIEGSAGNAITVEGQPRGFAVDASGNWWGDASGPSGAGPGAGDAVSGGVDFSNWLGASTGVVVTPSEPTVSVDVGQVVTLSVDVANYIRLTDVLDIELVDPFGWSASTEWSVPVSDLEPTMTEFQIEVPSDFTGPYVLSVLATSQADDQVMGSADIILASAGRFVALRSPAAAGDMSIDALGDGNYDVGERLVIDPGMGVEEEIEVAGFGSILLAAPLQFPHETGASIAPAESGDPSTPIDPDVGEHVPVPTVFRFAPVRNPMTSATHVRLAVPREGRVDVDLFDVSGRWVGSVFSGRLDAGVHEFPLAGDWSSGVYLLRAEGDMGTTHRRFTVVR